MAWYIDAYSANDYLLAGAQCYVTNQGSTLAVAADGTIMSLCRHKYESIELQGVDLVDFAKECGGYKLDCYDGLADLYKRRGFEVVGRTAWDLNYAPKDWRPEYGEEDLVSLELTDDFADIGLSRERVLRLANSTSIKQCNALVIEILDECCEMNDYDRQIQCMEMLEKILNRKGIGLELIKVPKDIETRLLTSLSELAHDDIDQTFMSRG